MPANSKSAQRFGAHLSVAGGLECAFERGTALGCDCLQIFVKNQRQWRAAPLTSEQVDRFRKARRGSGIRPVIAHGSYLINLASPDRGQWTRSIDAAVDELTRCERLGVSGLVLHPGAHMGEGAAAGLRRIVGAVDRIHRRTAGFRARLLLECTAGQGTCLGDDLGQLGTVLRGVRDPHRLHFCLDTCHLFAAGYDLRSSAEYERLIDGIRKELTLRRVRCIHMNDSRGACGSRLDRHEHIGKGRIGLKGFRHIVGDGRLAGIPKILETPKGTDGRGTDYDAVNLHRLRKLQA